MKYSPFVLSIVFAFCLHGETITPALVSNTWENAIRSMEDLFFDHKVTGFTHER